MALRFTISAASACLSALSLLAIGCDQSTPSTPASTSSPTTAAVSSTASDVFNTTNLDGPRTRLSLGAIPFSAEVPPGWQLQQQNGRTVLHGKTPKGEVDVLLGIGPIIKADALPLLIKQSAKASTDKHVKNEVVVRDNMTIVKSIAPEVPSNLPMASDPALIPIGWTVQCLVNNGQVDFSSYELHFLGLSQEMFDHDESFLQQIVDSIRFEPATTRPAMP